MNPSATIGIAFHSGRHLREALQSVWCQTWTDWELILMDDGSQDGALDLARSIEDPRVRVLSDGLRRGLAIRLNEMVRLAAGKFFFRMDADDMMHPLRLATQIEALRMRSRNTVIGTMAYSIGPDSCLLGQKRHNLPRSQSFAARRTFLHPTVAAHTSWFLNNPYSEQPIFHRCEDAELWCRTARHSRFELLDRPLLFYRESGPTMLERQIATQAGLLALLVKRFRRPFVPFFGHLCLELAKTATYAVCEETSLMQWIINRKVAPLSLTGRIEATTALQLIQATVLPLQSDEAKLVAHNGLRGLRRLGREVV